MLTGFAGAEDLPLGRLWALFVSVSEYGGKVSIWVSSNENDKHASLHQEDVRNKEIRSNKCTDADRAAAKASGGDV